MIAFLRSLFVRPEDPRDCLYVRSPGWRTVRARFLAAHPLCEACGRASDLECHHITPFWVRPDLECDPGNLITLCDGPTRSCHFAVGHAYCWKGWVPEVREDARRFHLRVLESLRLSRQRPL